MNTRISILVSQQMDSKVWYERLNLVGKAKRFCQMCAGSFWFWVAVALFTLVEPVLCSYKPEGQVFWAQVAVLAVSSVLYVIQIIGVATREWDKIVLIQAMSSHSSMIVVQKFTFVKLLIFFTAEGEYILEFCCLLGGWLSLFISRGVAVLRCFRVFRLLWFYEVPVFKSAVEETCNPLFGADFVARCFKVLRFAIKSLTAIGNEMFRLTNATRGGLLLMLMLFFSAFVLGTAAFIETRDHCGDETQCHDHCPTRAQCVYTLMRLSFYDGDAFNFIFELTDRHRFLFLICIVYMCITSFGILNGLVGIFGTAFAEASDKAFHEEKNDDGGSEGSYSEDGEDDEDADGADGDNGDAGGGLGGDDLDKEQRRLHNERLANMVLQSFRGDVDQGSDDDGESAVGPQRAEDRQEKASGGGGLAVASGKYLAPVDSSPASAHKQQHGKVGVAELGGGGGVAGWSSEDEAGSVGTGAGRAHGSDAAGDAVWAYEGIELAPRPRANSTASASLPPRHELLQQQVDSLAPRDKAEVQRRLAGKLGAKSQFAMQELQRMAADSLSNNTSPAAPTLRKGQSFTAKPVELRHTGTGRVVPFQHTEAVDMRGGAADELDQPPVASAHALHQSPPLRTHHHHHQAHSRQHPAPAVGMFAQTRNQRSTRSMAGGEQPDRRFAAAIAGSAVTTHNHAHAQQQHGHHSRDALHQHTLDIKALTLNVQSLTRTVEAQHELIMTMLNHLQGGKGAHHSHTPSQPPQREHHGHHGAVRPTTAGRRRAGSESESGALHDQARAHSGSDSPVPEANVAVSPGTVPAAAMTLAGAGSNAAALFVSTDLCDPKTGLPLSPQSAGPATQRTVSMRTATSTPHGPGLGAGGLADDP
jgi:hypothetical protein